MRSAAAQQLLGPKQRPHRSAHGSPKSSTPTVRERAQSAGGSAQRQRTATAAASTPPRAAGAPTRLPPGSPAEGSPAHLHARHTLRSVERLVSPSVRHSFRPIRGDGRAEAAAHNSFTTSLRRSPECRPPTAPSGEALREHNRLHGF